jgi:hypothetical protein
VQKKWKVFVLSVLSTTAVIIFFFLQSMHYADFFPGLKNGTESAKHNFINIGHMKNTDY